MPYSDFDLKKAKSELGLKLSEREQLFAAADAVEISPTLREILAENIPLARAINTEKARSELLISPILVEVRKILKHQISLFSGIEFNVDRERNLNGFCDFIISASPEQLLLSAPVIAIVDAKNENLIGGLGQCIAEMVATRIFNQREGNDTVRRVYGVVTTGTAWRFLKMDDDSVAIDLDEYGIEHTGGIVGVLLWMVGQKA